MELETQFKLNKSQEYITFLRNNYKRNKIIMIKFKKEERKI